MNTYRNSPGSRVVAWRLVAHDMVFPDITIDPLRFLRTAGIKRLYRVMPASLRELEDLTDAQLQLEEERLTRRIDHLRSRIHQPGRSTDYEAVRSEISSVEHGLEKLLHNVKRRAEIDPSYTIPDRLQDLHEISRKSTDPQEFWLSR